MRTLLRLFLFSFLAASSVALAQEADLAVTKTGPEQSAADTNVTYTVTVFNNGPDDAAPATLRDLIPSGMTFQSADATGAPGFVCSTPPVGSGGQVVCIAPTLPAGSSAVFTFVFRIPAGTAPGMFFTNIATAESDTDPNAENDSGIATTFTPFPPQSDLFVSKDGPSFAGPDTDVLYTISVGNNGPDDAASLTFDDTLPGNMTFVSLVPNSGPSLSCTTPAVGSGGPISCTAANYPAGATTTFTLTGHIPSASSASYTNTATVSTTEDPIDDNNLTTTTLTVSATDVSVVKTGPATAPAGDITYTITVANGGPDVANAVQFFDPLPVGTTFVSFTQDNGPAASCALPNVGTNGTVVCTWPTLPVGPPALFTLVIHSGSNTSITNTAFVTTQTFDTDGANDDDSVTTSVTPVADMAVSKTGTATIAAGTNATYTVTVTNDGPSHAASVSLNDTLAAELTFVSATQTAGPTFTCTSPAPGANGTISCTIATLAAGATATFSFVVHLDSSTAAGSSVSNTADVSTTTSDPDGTDDASTATATVTSAPPTDVTIAKSAGDDNPITGATVTYTIVVTNAGATDALDNVVTDTIPAGTTLESASSTQGTCTGTTTVTCTIGTLASGASATITLSVTLPATPGAFVNTAAVTISNGDTNDGNNADTATITTSAEAAGIPTLSPLALALLGVAFAMAGFVALRGRF